MKVGLSMRRTAQHTQLCEAEETRARAPPTGALLAERHDEHLTGERGRERGSASRGPTDNTGPGAHAVFANAPQRVLGPG